MKHNGRRPDLGKPVADIDMPKCILKTGRIVGRGRLAL
jgi:hypothetical protein